MTWEVIGTRHLGQARCICGDNPQGCPLHQRVDRILDDTDCGGPCTRHLPCSPECEERYGRA